MDLGIAMRRAVLCLALMLLPSAAYADGWTAQMEEDEGGPAMVASITAPANVPSWALMERLGMTRDPSGDFNHPKLGEGDPLRAHITYRIARP